MLTGFQWFSIICIVLITIVGGYIPLFRPKRAMEARGFPLGQAFAAGVFLALALIIMLPAASHLLRRVFPEVNYPLSSVIAIVVFLGLLALEHATGHLRQAGAEGMEGPSPASFPVIMTIMIAIPSFFLGSALGVSEGPAAAMIFIAIMAHKGTAGFALALKMVRSTLTRSQTCTLFILFACSTPAGIVVGRDIHQYLSGNVMFLVKGLILSLAAGTFLYISTLHELRHTPLIENCCSRKGFLMMICGFIITALVRLLLGEAHHM